MSIAEKAKNLRKRSTLLEGRDLITSDEIVKIFGKKGLTIDEIDYQKTVDRNTGDPRHYYICAIREDDSVAIGTGQVLTNMLDSLIETYGDIDQFNVALKQEDFTLIPSMKRSKNGNRYLDYEIA